MNIGLIVSVTVCILALVALSYCMAKAFEPRLESYNDRKKAIKEWKRERDEKI